MCIVVHLCKSQILDLQVMRFIRSYGGQHNNILEFDILWLSGAVPCPLCMLVNIKNLSNKLLCIITATNIHIILPPASYMLL